MSAAPHDRCDVLVVGSGGAGMSAAIAARAAGSSVVIATKSALGASNTGRAQGGIQAAVGEGDTVESHFEDTFAAGHRDAVPELALTLVGGGPEAIDWLASLGVAFSRDDGRYRVIRCGGASRERLLQAGERTGADMVQALRAAVRASGAELRESSPLLTIEPDGDGWRATLLTKAGELHIVAAAAVVLAAGGGLAGEAAALGVGSTNHPDATPEVDRKSTRLNSSHIQKSRMPSSA